MRYELKVDGLTELNDMLGQMEGRAMSVAAQALYEGAGVMAQEVTEQISRIQTAPFKYARPGDYRLPSPEEKAILEEAGAGIAKFAKDDDEVNTSVGFRKSGYADLNGEKKAIAQIANAINSGTSFMKKQPFLRKAFSQSKGAAESAIENGLKSRLDELDLG